MAGGAGGTCLHLNPFQDNVPGIGLAFQEFWPTSFVDTNRSERNDEEQEKGRHLPDADPGDRGDDAAYP